MIVYILIIALVIAVAVTVLVVINRRNQEIRRYTNAAQHIYRDKLLKNTLRNPYTASLEKRTGIDELFVYLKQLHAPVKSEHVFCAGDAVNIGRGRIGNQLILSDPAVSEYHCMIFACESGVYIRDLNSGNGTVLKRGFRKKSWAVDDTGLLLEDNDIISVGNTEFKIKIFYVNANLFS